MSLTTVVSHVLICRSDLDYNKCVKKPIMPRLAPTGALLLDLVNLHQTLGLSNRG